SELEHFRGALEVSRGELMQIRDGIAAELGDQQAAIYEAHLMILDDPELKLAVESGIRGRRRNAAWVFREYVAGVAARLEHVNDGYLPERLPPPRDVERRVIHHLLGDGPRSLSALVAVPSVLIAH